MKPAQGRLAGGAPSFGEVTACDSAWLFSLKALIFPVTALLTLLTVLLIWQRPLVGPYFLLGVLVFAGVGEFIELGQLDYRSSIPSALNALRYILLRWIALGACMVALLYLSHADIAIDDGPLLAWLLVTPFALWAAYLGVWMLLQQGARHMSTRRAVIVGVTEQGLQLDHMLRDQPLIGIRSLGFFDGLRRTAGLDTTRLDSTRFDTTSAPTGETPRMLGSIEELPAFVRKHNVNVVYITLPMSRNRRLLNLIKGLHDTAASIYFVPDVFAMSLVGARVQVIHGVPLIAICESPFYGMRALVKRASDVLLSGLILLMISPIMIAVALGVKWTSPGPVIFKQRRYGLDGQEITVYKFRSMTVTEDGASSYKQVTRGDARVTPFGAFIRRTSLDELPQFLNVLEGTMSIVGPRPHAVAVNERYRVQIPSYMVRHKVKPGITGWAQVNGYRGGDDLGSMTKRIEYDLDYLTNWSLLFDLKIIIRTFTVVMKDHHAF